jgi:plasmid maintenance system antidote protein VapI
MKKRRYGSLQEWMEHTGTPVQTLAQLAGMDRTHLSRVLTRSRRCSLAAAMRLSEVTGVPVQKLIEWKSCAVSPRFDRVFNSQV